MEKRIVKDFTLEMVNAWNVAEKCEAYSIALKSRCFVSKKRLSEALYAEKQAWNKVFELVSQKWGQYKTYSLTLRKDKTVLFTLNE